MKPPAANDSKDVKACCWLLSAKPVPKIRLNAIKSPDARAKANASDSVTIHNVVKTAQLKLGKIRRFEKIGRRDRKEKNFCAAVPSA
jgi:hypothetical protein